MARDDVIESLRMATRRLVAITESHSYKFDLEWVARRLREKPAWLTPESVEGYDPNDFSQLPEQQREDLQRAVEGFLEVARAVPPKTPATATQVEAALPHFLRIYEIVRGLVLSEWLDAVTELIAETEAWAREKGWIVKRDSKDLPDNFLGRHEAPLLLMHTIKAHLLLEPVARFILGGARGRVELCLLPGYDSLMLTHHPDGWYLHSGGNNGVRRKWSAEVLEDAVRQLSAVA